MKEELVTKAVSVLTEAGFTVSDCCSVRSCFDILARRDEELLLIKVLVNIEGITPKLAAELRAVSVALSAIPIVIGEHMKNASLSGGVIYTRYDLPVVNVGAFEEMLSKNGPSVYSIRGNYCVRVDGGMLSDMRKKVDLTQEELAAKLGVSKQSIHRYESSGRVSLDIAERMIKFLNEDLLVPGKMPASATSVPGHSEGAEGPSSERAASFRTELEKTVYYEFCKMGLNPSLTTAPFDILATEKVRRERILTIVSDDHRGLKKKIEIIQVICEITGSRPVCVSNRSCGLDVLVIKPKELSGIKDADDLIRRLDE